MATITGRAVPHAKADSASNCWLVSCQTPGVTRTFLTNELGDVYAVEEDGVQRPIDPDSWGWINAGGKHDHPNGVGQLTASRLYRDSLLKKNHLTGISQARGSELRRGATSPITLRLPLRSVLGTETACSDTAIG
jgi:hypothetical protein